MLAILLRIRGLLFPFDQDELYTVAESTLLFHSPDKPGIAARPLFFVIEHFLLWVGPATPTFLRLFPFVLGVAGVAVTLRLGSRLFGPVAGGTAGFLVAISPWHLYASGFARYYSLVYFLAAVFFYNLALAYEDDRVQNYVLAAIAGILGSITHPSFFFSALGAVLAVSLVRRDGQFGWRWPSRRALTWLWVPWAAVLTGAYLALRFTGQLSDLRNKGGRGVLPSIRILPAMIQWMTPTVAVAGLSAALLLLGLQRFPLWRRFGLMTALGAGGAGLLLLVAATRSDVYADYGIAMLPLLFVATGAMVELGAARFGNDQPRFALITAALLAAGILPSTVSFLSDGTRFDYRPALSEISAVQPSVPVLAWPAILARHYAPTLDVRELPLDPARLDAALITAGELWVVLSYREYGLVGDGDGAASAWIWKHCNRVRSDRGLRFDSRIYEVTLERCHLVN